MTEYAGRGDPRRSMDAAVGPAEPASRGPKPGLTVDAIVAAAIDARRRRGTRAVSMRRVAERLGKSADVALHLRARQGRAARPDARHGARRAADRPPRPRGWRAAVEASARDGWALYERHPWVLQVSGARAVLGPHELDAYEAQLRSSTAWGSPAVEMSRVVGALAGFVRGAAKAVSDARAAEQATGMSDDDWWNARSPLLEELAGDGWPERYPTLDPARRRARLRPARPSPDDPTPYLEREALARVRVRPAAPARRHRGLRPGRGVGRRRRLTSARTGNT